MKTKTISVFVLFAASTAFLVGFIVKTLNDWERYTQTVNSAPFGIQILANALFFVVFAVILSAVALFVLRKTRVLCICSGVFFLAAVVSAIVSGNFPDCLIYAVPAALSALACGFFALISRKLLTRA